MLSEKLCQPKKKEKRDKIETSPLKGKKNSLGQKSSRAHEGFLVELLHNEVVTVVHGLHEGAERVHGRVAEAIITRFQGGDHTLSKTNPEVVHFREKLKANLF